MVIPKFFVLILFTAVTVCHGFCGDGNKVTDGVHTYCLHHTEPMNYYQANAECQREGNQLASVTEEEENEFLQKMIDSYGLAMSPFWIGLTSIHMSLNSFRWTDGTKLEFNKLPKARNEKVGDINGKCINMKQNSDGNWFYGDCLQSHAFICKRTSRIPLLPEPPVGGYCPRGFFGMGNKCYKVVTIADNAGYGVNFASAQTECQKLTDGPNPNLASIGSMEENAEVTSLLYREEGNFWIGLKLQEGNWRWLDDLDTPLYYENWDTEPQSGHGAATIHGFNFHAGRWISQPDDIVTRHGFVCQVKKDPDNIINTPDPSPCINCPNYCAEGYVPFWRGCYKVVNTIKSWEDARQHCKTDRPDADLAVVLNEVENDALFMMFQSFPSQSSEAWMAMKDVLGNGEYTWDNSWPVIFTKWDVGEPSHKGRCVAMGSKGEWIAADCIAQKSFLCKHTADLPVTPAPETGVVCPSPKWKVILNSCFYFYTKKTEMWDKAVDVCPQLHPAATMAYVTSETENKLIANEMRPLTENNADFYIGLYRDDELAEFQWQGHPEEPVNFVNWGPDGPLRREKVVMLRKENNQFGQWMTHSNTQASNVICRMEKIDDYTMPEEKKGNCPDDNWVGYGDQCMLFETDTLNWDEAQAYCVDKGGSDASLVTIDEFNKHRFIWSHMLELMHNKESFWIGLRRDGIGDNFYWLQSENEVGYTNWMPGQPDTVLPHYCGAIDADEAQWYDTACDETKAFVCQAPRGSPGLSGGAIAGIVIGVLVSVALIVVVSGFVYQKKGGKLPSIPTPGISFNKFDDSVTQSGLPGQEVSA